jgi:hypothetical protein
LDLCALFNTLIADIDGIYHPGNANDRMLLGLKGTISEVEINMLKNRMLEGARNKARRGELIYRLPVGFVKTEINKIEKDPDKRIQQTIEQVFMKFRDTQSARQTFHWFVQEQIKFPVLKYSEGIKELEWKDPGYTAIVSVLKNPTYAGAYVQGRRETRHTLKGDNIIKTKGHMLEQKDWRVLIKNQFSGYISWEEYEKNQDILLENWKRMGFNSKGPVMKGNSLLAGLLRCKHCGHLLSVTYSGKTGKVPTYTCSGDRTYRGKSYCISFGGMRLDDAVSQEVLRAVEPLAIESSFKAIKEYNNQLCERERLMHLELEEAEYEAERACRQYNKAEPENRLVVSNLESKWDSCLKRVEEIKGKLLLLAGNIKPLDENEKNELLDLANDLPRLWDSETTTNEMKKRIIRAIIEEIMVDVDKQRSMIILNIHYKGGVHTELEVKKNRTGVHGKTTDKKIVELVRELAAYASDYKITEVLNRLGFKTGKGNKWTSSRVKFLRNYNKISQFQENNPENPLTLDEASKKLGICSVSVKKLIQYQIISARQVCAYAPWVIPKQELEKKEVLEFVSYIKNRKDWEEKIAENEGQLGLFT